MLLSTGDVCIHDKFVMWPPLGNRRSDPGFVNVCCDSGTTLCGLMLCCSDICIKYFLCFIMGAGRGSRGNGGSPPAKSEKRPSVRGKSSSASKRGRGNDGTPVKGEAGAGGAAGPSAPGVIDPCLDGVNACFLTEMSEALNRINAEPLLANLMGQATLTISEGGRHAPFNQDDFASALSRAEYSDSPFYVAGVMCESGLEFVIEVKLFCGIYVV